MAKSLVDMPVPSRYVGRMRACVNPVSLFHARKARGNSEVCFRNICVLDALISRRSCLFFINDGYCLLMVHLLVQINKWHRALFSHRVIGYHGRRGKSHERGILTVVFWWLEVLIFVRSYWPLFLRSALLSSYGEKPDHKSASEPQRHTDTLLISHRICRSNATQCRPYH